MNLLIQSNFKSILECIHICDSNITNTLEYLKPQSKQNSDSKAQILKKQSISNHEAMQFKWKKYQTKSQYLK